MAEALEVSALRSIERELACVRLSFGARGAALGQVYCETYRKSSPCHVVTILRRELGLSAEDADELRTAHEHLLELRFSIAARETRRLPR